MPALRALPLAILLEISLMYIQFSSTRDAGLVNDDHFVGDAIALARILNPLPTNSPNTNGWRDNRGAAEQGFATAFRKL